MPRPKSNLTIEQIKEKRKLYYQQNREKKLLMAKEYYVNNKEKVQEYKKNYRLDNQEVLKEKDKNYYNDNKDIISKKQRVYKKNRLKNDSQYKLRENISTLIRNSFLYSNHKKSSKTVIILGCSFEEFKLHLESKFEPWMTWDNYGKFNSSKQYGWDIDHIIPLSSAKSEEELVELNHYSNLQPLCSYVNRVIKRDKI